MRAHSQMNGAQTQPGGCGSAWPWSSAGRLVLFIGIAWLGLASTGSGQTFRLGPFEFTPSIGLELGYDSNVDDLYPDEEIPGYQPGDFYWMPSFSLRSQSTPMRPRTAVDLEGRIAYQDYFVRNDLDTELYGVNVGFQTIHPRLTLSGEAGTEYSVESEIDAYVPGGASRDPMKTDMAGLSLQWNYRKLRFEASSTYTIERHDYELYQFDDNDELTLDWAVYLDVWSWGSLFYSSERTYTTYVQPEPDREENENDRKFGLEGAIPVGLLKHPKITYQLGIESVDDNTDDTEGLTWEPMHTITVSDEFQLSRTVNLSASAKWENDVAEDDIGFTYDVKLEQQVGARAKHSLYWIREPGSQMGSTADTDTTTYGYDFSIHDLVFYNLTLSGLAEYKEETPLPQNAPTEETTTLQAGLQHTRQLSRRLSRNMGYQYTYETSNFHDEGPKEQHLATYALILDF